jgi:hypothetical protein
VTGESIQAAVATRSPSSCEQISEATGMDVHEGVASEKTRARMLSAARLSVGLRNRRSEVRILSGALENPDDHWGFAFLG